MRIQLRAIIIGSIALCSSPRAMASPPRSDILVNLAHGGAGFIHINDTPMFVLTTGGRISLETNDIQCVASENHPCSYRLGALVLNFTSLRFSGADITNATLTIQDPIDLRDEGDGIVIPTGTDGILTYWQDGSPSGRTGRMSTKGRIHMKLSTQEMVLQGGFEGSEGGITVSAMLLAYSVPPFANLPPTAVAGADQSVCLGWPVHLDASASTDPNNDITSYFWSEGGTVLNPDPNDPVFDTSGLSEGSHTILLTVVDSHGGQGTDTVVVHVLRDTTPPVFVHWPPANVEIFSCNDPDIGSSQAQATDNCPGIPQITYDIHTFTVGTTQVTYTARDVAGNIATWHQEVMTGPPVFNLPPTPTIQYSACDNATEPPNLGTAEGRDVCGGVLTIAGGQITNDAPSTFPFGKRMVHWKATDASGRFATASQEVTITATDLGAVNSMLTVPNNACLQITQYPADAELWMKSIRMQAHVDWPAVFVPFSFSWTNICPALGIDNRGSGNISANWQDGVVRPVQPGKILPPATRVTCPTQIQLRGNGTQSVSLAWWGNG